MSKKPKPEIKVRPLGYLPNEPRFDELRHLFVSNELKRAEQYGLQLEPAAASFFAPNSDRTISQAPIPLSRI